MILTMRLIIPVRVMHVRISPVLISGIFYLAMQDGDECLSNPLVYGAKKAITVDSGPLMCSCSFQSPLYAPFYFDDKNISITRALVGLEE